MSTSHKLCGSASLHQFGKLGMHIDLPMQVQVTWWSCWPLVQISHHSICPLFSQIIFVTYTYLYTYILPSDLYHIYIQLFLVFMQLNTFPCIICFIIFVFLSWYPPTLKVWNHFSCNDSCFLGMFLKFQVLELIFLGFMSSHVKEPLPFDFLSWFMVWIQITLIIDSFEV